MRVQRKATSPRIRSVRPIERADLARLQEPSSKPMIQKLRDSHHLVARLIASGLRLGEVAAQSGYSIGRISYLANNPAMIELVAKYRASEDQSWRESRDEYFGLIHANGIKAQRQIADALDAADENNEPVPLNRLLAIAADSADRVGYTRKTTNFNVNVDFAAKLEQARRRSLKVIDAS